MNDLGKLADLVVLDHSHDHWTILPAVHPGSSEDGAAMAKLLENEFLNHFPVRASAADYEHCLGIVLPDRKHHLVDHQPCDIDSHHCIERAGDAEHEDR